MGKGNQAYRTAERQSGEQKTKKGRKFGRETAMTDNI